MRNFSVRDISVCELSTFDTQQLRELAGEIAVSHAANLTQLLPENLNVYVNKAHEFGVSFDGAKGKTIEGKSQRLCDSVFWFGQLRQIADRARECIAARSLRLGDSIAGLEPYCSDESLAAYIERQAGRSVVTLQSLRREIEKAAHGNYLMAKALCEQAFAAGHLSILITLGLDGRYHSSSPHYRGFTFDDAHAALNGLLEPLLDGLSRRGTRGVDFLGARCIEVHPDGCPHWHVVIYLRPDLLPYLIKRLRALYCKQSEEMGAYFDLYSDEIVKVREPIELGQYAEAVSYIFKNSYAGRSGSINNFMGALRQKVAISAHGKRQYDFIGMSGSRSVMRELRKRKSVGGVAGDLVLDKNQIDRKERQYSAVKDLVNGGLGSYELIKSFCVNRYGEEVVKVVGVRFLGGFPGGGGEVLLPLCSGVICNDSRIKVFSFRLSISVHYFKFRARAPPTVVMPDNVLWQG